MSVLGGEPPDQLPVTAIAHLRTCCLDRRLDVARPVAEGLDELRHRERVDDDRHTRSLEALEGRRDR